MGSTIFTPFTDEQLIPKEEKLEVLKKGKNLVSEFLRKLVLTKKTMHNS
jgi:alanine dehydrogenase